MSRERGFDAVFGKVGVIEVVEVDFYEGTELAVGLERGEVG